MPFGKPSDRDDARELAYRQWFTRQHPLALPALLLSAFSLTHFGTLWIDEVAGIVLAIVVLVQLSRARRDETNVPDRDASGKIAWAAIIVGTISLASAVVVYFVLPTRR